MAPILILFTDDCFRLQNLTQAGVVYENETEILPARLLLKPKAAADNRTQTMIVANEISNLPRFDPKNAGQMLSRQVMTSTDATLMADDALLTIRATTSESPSPSPSTSSSSQLPQPADPEEVTSLRNASSSEATVSDPFDRCQFCPEARFLQHYFSKGCIAMHLQPECKPKFCPAFFECPPEKELPKDGKDSFLLLLYIF